MPQPVRSAPKRYHPALVSLHWIIAILIFSNIFLAVSMKFGGDKLGSIPLINIHMTFGLTILALMIARLAIRFLFQRPAWADTGIATLNKVGEATHWLLYLLTFGMTISGIMLASETDDLPQLLGMGTGLSGFNLGWLHGTIWILLLLLILLHIGAAMFHQFFLRDHLLRRMWFGKK